MAKVIELPYKPREWANGYHDTSRRYRILVLHRKAGKTTGALNHLIREATTDPKVLAKRRGLEFDEQKLKEWRSIPRLFGYIGPYYSQSKTIAWDILKYYSSFIPGIKINEAELRIDYPGNGRIRLFGADNTESLRGPQWWEVLLDEFKDHDPDMWREVISPGCILTAAPISFLGTIKGKDHLWRLYQERKEDELWYTEYLKASKSGILTEQQLKDEKNVIGEAKFMQEYELEPMATIEGAIWGAEMRWLRENKRITKIPIEEYATVDTYWDLGIADYLVVVFMQSVGLERRIIDCYATHGTNLAEVAKTLEDKGYRYGTHYLPHDATQRELQTGRTREDFLKQTLRGEVKVIPRVKVKEEAIQEFRLHAKKLWINEDLTTLLDAMEQYQQEFDEHAGVWKAIPKHDWCSHYADALQCWSSSERLNFAYSAKESIIESNYPAEDGGDDLIPT